MGPFSPEVMLIGLTALCVVVAAIVMRSMRSTRLPRTVDVAIPAVVPLQRTTSPSETNAAPAKQPAPTQDPTARATAPQPAPRSPSQPSSYTAIAVAEAAHAAPKPAPVPPAGKTGIDYSNALAGIRPDASYTAIAIATVLGVGQQNR